MLEEIPEPVIGKTVYSPEDVIVEVKLCGICGTELNIWRDGFPKSILNVKQVGLGHELSGVVIEAGEKASGINKGDRVVAEVSIDSCGICPLCLSGRNNLCKFASSFMLYQGAFSKYLPLPAKNVHKIPDKTSFEEAALCQPLAIAINALELRAKVKTGESVAILGPGPIGLCLLQIAKLSGAWPVVVTGLKADEKRLEIAKTLGADFTINVDEEDLFQRTKDITNFEGFDVVVEIAGSGKAVNQALDIVKTCGRVVLAGAGYHAVEIDASKKIMVKQIDLLGCRGDPTIAWIKTLRLLETGKLNLKPIISDILPLSEWEEGFRLANSRNSLKVLLQP
ncbi:MAG: hypothetical protein A2043_11165 [Candidatus Schekmanbacteria bacterium GWA2_38_9]|uniref:Enoyl reductase (ER) domain-containing protein n=1 Tax=Candidatus Schekmanbacteria bacterium RIFCSPLOWO2_12_FULL_38_15 TaxID=1817883 RepID=A0A1F7SGB1_9BACT|nr:MAG: hypothetical protein A2043_11165 [Candidatus Schekmanbacteria bacterium GWA2_38_9]OGL52781.1 MAG: hypothetical protein A3G31_00065 [Candidatus Schekmanbacteria bacterium RIFCSPLOWO2_12_FULL_38_15]